MNRTYFTDQRTLEAELTSKDIGYKKLRHEINVMIMIMIIMIIITIIMIIVMIILNIIIMIIKK